MGPEFFQTGMGHTFYEGHVPKLVHALESIAKSLEAHVSSAPAAPDGSLVTWLDQYVRGTLARQVSELTDTVADLKLGGATPPLVGVAEAEALLRRDARSFGGGAAVDPTPTAAEFGEWELRRLLAEALAIIDTADGDAIPVAAITRWKYAAKGVLNPHVVWRACPYCGGPMTFIGSLGVTAHDGGGDAQADRFDCDKGHTFLVVETARLDEQEPG